MYLFYLLIYHCERLELYTCIGAIIFNEINCIIIIIIERIDILLKEARKEEASYPIINERNKERIGH